MEETIRIAAIGTGYFSQFHYEAWRRLEGVRVVGLSARNLEKAKSFAEERGIPRSFDNVAQMLDELEPDLLDIISPPETHLEYVTEAAKRGIGVVCQKPVAPTFSEAVELLRVAEEAGIFLAIHENFRFMPWFRKAKELLGNGTLGAPHAILFRFRPGDGQGPNAYLDRQPYFQKMKRFLIHETGIHYVDTFRYLLGHVSAVHAILRRMNPVIEGEDGGYVMFEFQNRASGLFDGNRLNDHLADNCRLTLGEMWLEGSNGVLRLDGFARLWFKPHGEPEDEVVYSWENRGFGGDCVYRFQKHVIDHLKSRSPLETSGRAYLANLKIEEAIYLSNSKGQRIPIEE
jgi:predicted dehydrogenase